MADIFEQKISMGNLLTIVTLLCGGAIAWLNLSNTITRVDTRLDGIEIRLRAVEGDHDTIKVLQGEVEALLGKQQHGGIR